MDAETTVIAVLEFLEKAPRGEDGELTPEADEALANMLNGEHDSDDVKFAGGALTTEPEQQGQQIINALHGIGDLETIERTQPTSIVGEYNTPPRQGDSAHQVIEVPDVRQPNHFTCGAAATMSVGRYFGVGPADIKEWIANLHTDVEQSTSPLAIIRYLKSLGLQVDFHSGMTLDALAKCVNAGQPVICPIQDYGPEVPKKAEWQYGHYVVVIGVLPGYFVIQDPSEDNVVAGGDKKPLAKMGSIQKPGRIMVDVEAFERAWHDKDAKGTPLTHFGIIVGPARG